MRWEDERYVRVYTRDTPEWCLLSWEARGIFVLLLRVVDRAGLLHLGRSGPRAVAALLRAPVDVVERALAELEADGCVAVRDGVLIIANFQAAQEARQSDKARAAKARERARVTAESSRGVTEESHGVTGPSRGVTSSHTASLRTVPYCAVPCSPPEGGAAPTAEPSPPPAMGSHPAPSLPTPAPPVEQGQLEWVVDTQDPIQATPSPQKRREKASPAKQKKPEPQHAAGWRIWRKLYVDSRRGYGKYTQEPADGEAMKKIVEHALRILAEDGRSIEDLEPLLTHWFKAYLRDDGSKDFRLLEKAHALRFMARGIPVYGTPWSKPEPKPTAASPPAPFERPPTAEERRASWLAAQALKQEQQTTGATA